MGGQLHSRLKYSCAGKVQAAVASKVVVTDTGNTHLQGLKKPKQRSHTHMHKKRMKSSSQLDCFMRTHSLFFLFSFPTFHVLNDTLAYQGHDDIATTPNMDERTRLTHSHHTLRLASFTPLSPSSFSSATTVPAAPPAAASAVINIINLARSTWQKETKRERTKKEKEIRNMTNLTNHPKAKDRRRLNSPSSLKERERERSSKSLVSSWCSIYRHVLPSPHRWIGDEMRLLLLYLLVDCSSSQAKTCRRCRLRDGDPQAFLIQYVLLLYYNPQ